MKKIPAKIALLIPALLLFVFMGDFGAIPPVPAPVAPPVQTVQAPPQKELRVLSDTVKKGETLSAIFKKFGLDAGEMAKLHEASVGVHKLRQLRDGRPYRIVVDDEGRIDSFSYGINDDNTLKLTRSEEGYSAEKLAVAYEKRILHVGRTIKNSLIAAMEEGGANLVLALQLSDIFAGDIDFSTDLRTNDTFKIVIEGLYLKGRFVKFGEILASEFVNNGKTFRAYGFAQNGKLCYYDQTGKSLRRSFLKSPLSFSRISSGFSKGRFHPILKIFRPHQGIDYAAAAGTPVSAAGDGQIAYAGYMGQYGNMVIIRHRGGLKTCYGHLSRIAGGVKAGAHVDQGNVIGFVGSTGLATGPHLHYEMRVNDRPVSPASVRMPHGEPLPESQKAVYRELMDRMNSELDSVTTANEVTALDSARAESARKS